MAKCQYKKAWQMTEEEDDSGMTLDEVVGGPYPFTLKNGLTLELDEWTIDAEKWAKAHYKSMNKLFNTLMHIGVDDDACIDAAIDVAVYKLTDNSRRTLEEKMKLEKSPLTTENYLRKNITYTLLAKLCGAEYDMIKNSIPIDALKKSQKLMKKIQAQGMTL